MPYAAIVLSIIGTTVSVKSLSWRMNQQKEENEKKMATTVYVKQESAKIEVMALNASKDIADLKADNIRDHENIRKDISQKLDFIIKIVSEFAK